MKTINNGELITFNNALTTVGFVNNNLATEDAIKKVPQCYRYAANDAIDLDNVIISSFVKTCILDVKNTNFSYKYTSLDTRVHMLKPTMLPCIGGWHCDDFYRGDNGQPLLKNIDVNCPQRHYICTIGETSLPEFFVSDLTLKIDPDKVYKSLQENSTFSEEEIETWDIYQPKSGEIIRIGPSAIHRGIPADKAGWRLFMRLTFSNHRFPKNEIRTQTQVYLTNMDGW